MIIEKFQPIEIKEVDLNINELNIETGVNWEYAVSGKAALYHCLKSLKVEGRVLIPVYICSSILDSLVRLNIPYSCYDINLNDLNANLKDVEKKIIDEKIKCLLVASMYGNPACLAELECLCKKHNVFMIDDAAQTFGAKYNDRFVGTFGDAGFFSFSPGKATSGHLGAFFWTKNSNYKFDKTNNYILHKLAYLDFYFNRYHIYKYKKFKIFKILTYVKFVLFKIVDLYSDRINDFEKVILGGVLSANKIQKFRAEILHFLKKELSTFSNIQLITLGADNTNNHKIVLLCDTSMLANFLFIKLNKSGIYTSYGYRLIKDYKNCPNAEKIVSRILELPLEPDKQKNIYIIKQLNKLLQKHEDSGNYNHL